MGLSVSASAAIILIGFVLVFGTLYPAIENSQDIKNEARKQWLDWKEEKQKAEMTIESLEYTNDEDRLNISLKNTGDTVLEIKELEVFLDGVYSTDKLTREVVDHHIENTDIWNPGQHLNLTLEPIEEGFDRVLVVNEFGSEAYHTLEAG
ncbi:MAG: hypothetical protein V5A88_04490 [Candidatus Thermoplasmatota archaeon]